MGYTKRQFIDMALEEIGVASYEFDISPEELQSALKKLDAMMATWNARGIRCGYPIPSSPENSTLTEETNVIDAANEAIYLNLAVRIAPSLGKMAMRDTKVNAKASYKSLMNVCSETQEMQFPRTLPRGQGNKNFGNRNFNKFFVETDPITVGRDAILNLKG